MENDTEKNHQETELPKEEILNPGTDIDDMDALEKEAKELIKHLEESKESLEHTVKTRDIMLNGAIPTEVLQKQDRIREVFRPKIELEQSRIEENTNKLVDICLKLKKSISGEKEQAVYCDGKINAADTVKKLYKLTNKLAKENPKLSGEILQAITYGKPYVNIKKKSLPKPKSN